MMDLTTQVTNILIKLRQENPEILFGTEHIPSERRDKLIRFSYQKGEIEDAVLFDFGFGLNEDAMYTNISSAILRNIEILEREPAEGV